MAYFIADSYEEAEAIARALGPHVYRGQGWQKRGVEVYYDSSLVDDRKALRREITKIKREARQR